MPKSYMWGPGTANPTFADLLASQTEEEQAATDYKRGQLQDRLRNAPNIEGPSGVASTLGGGIAQLGQGIAAAISQANRRRLQQQMQQFDPEYQIMQALMQRGQR